MLFETELGVLTLLIPTPQAWFGYLYAAVGFGFSVGIYYARPMTTEGTAIRAQSPFNRVAAVEEVAKAIYMLSSPDMQWASGAVLDFNGASFLRV